MKQNDLNKIPSIQELLNLTSADLEIKRKSKIRREKEIRTTKKNQKATLTKIRRNSKIIENFQYDKQEYDFLISSNTSIPEKGIKLKFNRLDIPHKNIIIYVERNNQKSGGSISGTINKSQSALAFINTKRNKKKLLIHIPDELKQLKTIIIEFWGEGIIKKIGINN